MTNVTSRALQATLAAFAGVGLFMVNDVSPLTSGPFVAKAHAIIGRPLTPMSYAGVARRTTRRAYGVGAYGAPVIAAPAYGAPGGCVQVADAYGRLITRCY
jgi:hypothetical protein